MDAKLKWNLFGIFSLTLILTLTLQAIAGVFASADAGLVFAQILTPCMDIVGMFVCAILFSSVLYDRRMTRASWYFLVMVLTLCILLFSEYGTYIYNGRPDYYRLVEILNYYVYGLLIVLLLIHWIYLKQQKDIEDSAYEKAETVYYFCFFAGMAMLAANVFTGWLFHIERASGLYVSGDLNFLSCIFPLIMLFINAYCARFVYHDRKRRNIMYLYTVMCISALMMQVITLDAVSLCIMFLFVTFLIHGGFYVERGEEITRKDTEIVEQNVTMMISQIQPYFLYSSLTAIGKMEGNPPETTKAIADFSKYLRSNLSTISQSSTIPFSKEMEHVQTYVDLEKLRFKDKLNVVYTITDTDFDIPPLTLQMLVENAIKHGITQQERGGTVTIITNEDEHSHRITVTDDGVGFDTSVPPSDESRSHVGILNITERLRELLDGKLEISSEVGRGTVAVVTIPKNMINTD